MNKLGLNPTSLATLLREQHGLLSTRQSTMDQLVKGKTKSFRRMSELAAALQTTVEWLLTGKNKEEIHLTVAKSSARTTAQFGPDLVPIFGHANCSQDAVMINFDEPIGWAPRHPAQAGAENAFNIQVVGDSMSPRHRHAEIARVNGGQIPLRGQDCFIEMNNGEGYLKIYERQTAKEIICNQLNPEKEWKRPLSEVRAIHAVVR